MNASRASGSLKSRPPATRGSTVYHTTYAGSSQKYTSGCPKYQNSMRASSGSTVLMSPSDQGINRNSISAAQGTPGVLHRGDAARGRVVDLGLRSDPGLSRLEAGASGTARTARAARYARHRHRVVHRDRRRGG